MLTSYVRIAFSDLTKIKLHSFFSTTWRSVGIAVTLLIVLWINEGSSFDKYHRNYKSFAQVIQHQTSSEKAYTQPSIHMLFGDELRDTNVSYIDHRKFTGNKSRILIAICKKNKLYVQNESQDCLA